MIHRKFFPIFTPKPNTPFVVSYSRMRIEVVTYMHFEFQGALCTLKFDG